MASNWKLKNLQCDYQNLIPFIPASKVLEVEDTVTEKSIEEPTCSGEEIKKYYEEVTKRDGPKQTRKKAKNRSNFTSCKTKKDQCIPKTIIKRDSSHQDTNKHDQLQSTTDLLADRIHFEMLKYSQNGDVRSLEKVIEGGAHVDYQDNFGWTALMCASLEGHLEIVKFLLDKDANLDLLNNQKETARDLADKRRHYKILKVLDEKKHYPLLGRIKQEKITVEDEQLVFCEVCKIEFRDQKKHETSTTHLFNRQIKPSSPSFVIPESNRGFQMMLKHGWNKHQGLGSEGQGQKYPVKTILKRDRHGLGTGVIQKPKVTHFSAKDTDAIKRIKKNPERNVTSRTLSKWEMRRKEKKDKQWEQNMRRYLNSD